MPKLVAPTPLRVSVSVWIECTGLSVFRQQSFLCRQENIPRKHNATRLR